MNADIVLSELPSIIYRNTLENGGIREIDAPEIVQAEGSWLDDIFGFAQKLLPMLKGFLSKTLQTIRLAPFTSGWSSIVQTTRFLWNFDFNATDEQLDQQLNNIKLILAGQLGGTLGNLVGYLGCGIVPAAVIFKFNKPLGLVLLKEVGEEALDELLSNLAMLCRSAFNLGIRYLLTTAYKSARRAIKNWLSNPLSPQSQMAKRLFGSDMLDKIKAWGDGKGVWSIATEFNEFIDNIENPALQEFTEEFFEELFDACTEAGYIVARGLDDWWLKQKLQQDTIFGAERGVEITLDREAESERVILVGPDKLIKPAMTQVMTNYQLVENRDLGQFVGEPVRDYVKGTPAKFSIKLVWSRFDSPPMFQGGKTYKPPTLEIKNFSRTRIDFDRIKMAMGGANGRDWGRFWASAALLDNDGNIVARPLLFGGSQSQAENLLIELLLFSEYEIGSMNSGEELRVGRKANGRALAKETMRVYPAYMTILNAEKVLSEEEGQDQLAGTYKWREQRLELWTDQKPPEWDSVVTEMLRTPGMSQTAP